jgi:hypothetical protein
LGFAVNAAALAAPVGWTRLETSWIGICAMAVFLTGFLPIRVNAQGVPEGTVY